MLGAIEAGGTKFVLAIGNENGDILEKISIPTEDPELTMEKVINFFKDKDIKSLGIACFGPLELNKEKENFGYITSTPKLAWANYDILGTLKENLNIPVEINTDVSGAALGEITFGDYQNENTLLYITVGTGIGGGYVIDGKIHSGMLHPEMGHILINKNPLDSFEGSCPYHKNCLEGLASGPANEERTGMKGIDIPDADPSFDFIAEYIAEALMTYILVLSPTKIILGGGVMAREFMIPKITNFLSAKMNGYLKTNEMDNLKDYIKTPSLGTESGIKGALALASLAK
ncbi:MAG: ROK family protein [Clostridium sp.]|nr:ROK family protein [Clostridium sp.]